MSYKIDNHTIKEGINTNDFKERIILKCLHVSGFFLDYSVNVKHINARVELENFC